jgi:hypothetical protein
MPVSPLFVTLIDIVVATQYVVTHLLINHLKRHFLHLTDECTVFLLLATLNKILKVESLATGAYVSE